ncbi:MAG TPA: helix-turn-helix transcriptional regulator [Candidatus Limnocylindria bacterium]|nr:helix-turn-helix transcriptional regulator [Candidatus Limnocylindria bacterium]
MNGEAERRAVWLSRRIGQEVQTTRRTLGWSQRGLGVRAGVPQSTVWRIEHGSRHANIETLCRITTALALDLNVRAFPSTRVRIRDERQLARIGFITARASTLWHPQLEVRVTPDPADARAIDLVLSSAVEVVAVEVEGDLADFQAQLRPDLAKRDLLAARESRPVRFVLALPDTRRLRGIVKDHASLVARTLPASSRHIWASIRSGNVVGGDGILWLPAGAASVRR